MDETIRWEYATNGASKPPVRGHHYLVRGSIIDDGRLVREVRLTTYDGNKFVHPTCEDMVIERYAQIIV